MIHHLNMYHSNFILLLQHICLGRQLKFKLKHSLVIACEKTIFGSKLNLRQVLASEFGIEMQ